jgi:hypothetical protein
MSSGTKRVVIRPRPKLVERLTTRMPKIDARLLAIARGEIEDGGPPEGVPVDPYGGLVPVVDDEAGSWLESDVEPEPFSVRPAR